MTLLAPVPVLDGLRFNEIERGILWSLVYASIFGAPVKKSEISTRIVGVAASDREVHAALSGKALERLVVESGESVWLRSVVCAEAERRHEEKARRTQELLSRHEPILRFVRGLRGVRLAALSGGCAHGAADDDDIDIFMIAETGRLWRTLLATTLVAKARGWRRILCLNYLVDTSALPLPARDFYSAFEMISLRPIKGAEAFQDLLAANSWAAAIFPNFFRAALDGQNSENRTPPAPGFHPLEATARMIHRPYLRYRLPQGTGVELSDHVVRLHATDHRSRLRGLFKDALQRIGLEAPPWT